MRTGILVLVLYIHAFSPSGVSSETIMLKSGEALEAAEIVPAGNVLRVRRKWWMEVRKKDLTPEQQARYFGSPDGNYFSFTTMKVASNQEYTYYYNGKYAGTRLTAPDGRTLYYRGSVPDGVYREFYPGDALEKEQAIVGNLRNGPLRTYFKDGGLRSETWFLDDTPNGVHRLFDSGGNLLSEERFIRGRSQAGKAGYEGEKPGYNGKAQPARKKT